MITILFGILSFFQVAVQPAEPELINRAGQNFQQYKVGGVPLSLFQSENGYLWVGTTDGVRRFDGYSFLTYEESLTDTSEIYFSGNWVWDIAEDSRHTLWAGTRIGPLNTMDKMTDRFMNRASDLSKVKDVNSMLIDRFNTIWVLSDSLITRIFPENQDSAISTPFAVDQNIPGKDPMRLFEASDGQIYLLYDGIYELFDTGNGKIRAVKVYEGTFVRSLVELEPGKFLTHDMHKLYLWSPGEAPVPLNINIDAGRKWIKRLYKDNEGYIWVADQRGVSRLKMVEEGDPEIIFYAIGEVFDILQDNAGNLFFASTRGLVKLEEGYEQYRNVSFPEPYEKVYAYKFESDRYDRFWIGTIKGLYIYDDRTDEFITTPDTQQIFSIVNTNDQKMWVASTFGLRIYDINSGSLIEEIPLGFTHTLTLDESGSIWGINQGKLIQINSETNEIENIGLERADFSRIDKVFIDVEGTLWVLDRDRTIRKYDIRSGSPELLSSFDQLELRFPVNWIEDDLNGNLWMSTNRGVIVFNKEKGRITDYYNEENKLRDNNTFEVIRDRKGTLWLKQTQVGSVAMNPLSREPVLFTPNWLTKPGERGYYCVSAIDQRGRLYTDGRGGFFVFDPDKVEKNDVVPIIHLDGMLVDDSLRKDVKFRYDENDLEFRYTGLHFSESSRNEYAYLLEGYEDSWNYVGNSRIARYLSLPPGEYTFRVKASNSDGIWSEDTALASFVITPVWWQTGYAYFAYLILLVALVYIAYRAQLTRRLAISEATRLKEMDEFKNNFFTNITHEFRTPLTVINGVAGRLKNSEGASIRRNADKLLSLINQILELSRLESNKANISYQRGEIVQYLIYLAHSYQSYAEENGVTFTIITDQDEIVMDFDKEKVDLILQNLISNAIKYTPEGGVVRLYIGFDKQKLLIEVNDNGVGISGTEQEKIFDRYYRSPIAGNGLQGTGIGLSLTRELVQLMGGTISVQSETGVGSTFTVRLPMSIHHGSVPPEVEVKKIEAGSYALHSTEIEHPEDSELILLVEDNTEVRQFVKSIIAPSYRVVTATNGREGLENALNLIPDVIITDVMMPEMDGLELTSLLKRDDKTSHIPVIMLTAKAGVEARLDGLKKGADIYLPKPFNEEELKLQITNLIGRLNSIRSRYATSGNVEEIQDEFLIKIKDLILTHLTEEDYGISELCAELGVSRSQLHRKLKSLTGVSTSIFIRGIRLQEARSLLMHSPSMTVSEVAYKVGFSDPNYFTKVFTEKYQHPPSQTAKKDS